MNFSPADGIRRKHNGYGLANDVSVGAEPQLRRHRRQYTVRVENLNYECDLRVFLSTLKAKYVQKIQICDNSDVMKGSRSLGGVSQHRRLYCAQIQYDGVFNDAGTALSVVADYEYYDNCSKLSNAMYSSNDRTRELWQVYIVELWTPIAEGLELCAGCQNQNPAPTVIS